MAKRQVAAIVKIQIPAGQATPAPPVGTALGPHGINIMAFVKEFNSRTQAQAGLILPAEEEIPIISLDDPGGEADDLEF